MRSLASAMLEFRPRSRERGVRVARVRRSPRLRPAGRSARDFGSSRQRRCNPYKYLRNSGEFFSGLPFGGGRRSVAAVIDPPPRRGVRGRQRTRSEEDTSELQSPCNLVCPLLLEKKKKTNLPAKVR